MLCITVVSSVSLQRAAIYTAVHSIPLLAISELSLGRSFLVRFSTNWSNMNYFRPCRAFFFSNVALCGRVHRSVFVCLTESQILLLGLRLSHTRHKARNRKTEFPSDRAKFQQLNGILCLRVIKSKRTH